MSGVDEYTKTWIAEYQFRKAIPITHQQYLSEPAVAARWMREIDALMKKRGGDPSGRSN